MKNQYSFRLTTTLLPTDTTAKVTQVINKVDSEGNKFYPTFTEETVVITNDDRTIMETTRAVCTDGAITFTKRWLPDDGSLEPVDNRKLTWNPWSLLFITLWASDIIDKDDDMVWQWDQTYLWKAEYKWRLITEKGVEYPHFDTLADLQAYWTPFGWMFAVVDASGELYRYNDVTEEWGVVTTNEPTNPEQASTSAIGTVRVATQAEFNAGTEKWSSGEYLVPTIPQVKSLQPEMELKYMPLNYSQSWSTGFSLEFTTTHSWFAVVQTTEWYKNWNKIVVLDRPSSERDSLWSLSPKIDLGYISSAEFQVPITVLVPVKKWTNKLGLAIDSSQSTRTVQLKITWLYYYE